MLFDFAHFVSMLPDIWKAFGETVLMIGISLTVVIVIGLPLGIVLFVTDKGLFWENRIIKGILDFILNMVVLFRLLFC